MWIRRAAMTFLVVMAFVAGMVWQRQMGSGTDASPDAVTQAPPAMPEGDVQIAEPPPGIHPGLAWTVPGRWTTLPQRSMRVATYSIPAAGGDPEPAECAVFYFGPTQGGGVEDNIARWVDQFENAGKPRREKKAVHGFALHRVEVTGDYLAPSGPMMQSSGTKPRYMLLGAIVEGPAGGVFFKLTGPEKTVRAAAGDFDAMLASIRKE